MTASARKTGWTIGGLALVGLAIAGGYWAFPEFRRYVLIHRM